MTNNLSLDKLFVVLQIFPFAKGRIDVFTPKFHEVIMLN